MKNNLNTQSNEKSSIRNYMAKQEQEQNKIIVKSKAIPNPNIHDKRIFCEYKYRKLVNKYCPILAKIKVDIVNQ